MIFYLFGSVLWVEGLLSAMHGSWAGIVLGVPVAVMGAFTTRVSLFPLQSYDAVGKVIQPNERNEFLLIPIPEAKKPEPSSLKPAPIDAIPRHRA